MPRLSFHPSGFLSYRKRFLSFVIWDISHWQLSWCTGGSGLKFLSPQHLTSSAPFVLGPLWSFLAFPRTCRSADSPLHPGPLWYWNYCLRPFACLLLLGTTCFVSSSTFLSLYDPFFFTPCSWPWSCTPCPFWDYMTLSFLLLVLVFLQMAWFQYSSMNCQTRHMLFSNSLYGNDFSNYKNKCPQISYT